MKVGSGYQCADFDIVQGALKLSCADYIETALGFMCELGAHQFESYLAFDVWPRGARTYLCFVRRDNLRSARVASGDRTTQKPCLARMFWQSFMAVARVIPVKPAR